MASFRKSLCWLFLVPVDGVIGFVCSSLVKLKKSRDRDCSQLGSTGMKISFEIANPNYGFCMLLKTREIQAKISVKVPRGTEVSVTQRRLLALNSSIMLK